MIYQVERIQQDVRVCLDQNMLSAPLAGLGDPDTLALDEIIRSKVEEGVRHVHSTAPYHLLEEGHNFGDAVYWGEMESGWVLLPADFMRLVVFEMDDWSRAVYSVITPGSPEYERQRSRFKAIRGTADRPVCALCVRPEGKVLEFYSCKTADARVSRAVYLPFPRIDASGGIDVCERCYEAVIYRVAGLSLVTLGEVEKAASFMELAKTRLSHDESN